MVIGSVVLMSVIEYVVFGIRWAFLVHWWDYFLWSVAINLTSSVEPLDYVFLLWARRLEVCLDVNYLFL